MENGAAAKKLSGRVRRAGLVALLGALAVLEARPQNCSESLMTFSEHFSTTDNIDLAKSPAQFWCLKSTSPRDIVTLNYIGANFQTSFPAYIPTWINAVAVGDIDLDGWPDFIGSSSDYSNVYVFVRNMGVTGQVGSFQIAKWIDGCSGGYSGTPSRGVGGASLDSGHVCLTSGDYDKDGDIDFLVITSDSGTSPTPTRIYLYKNRLITNGVKGSVVDFTRVDMTYSWRSKIGGLTWTATAAQSLDFDGDGDVDILYGNSSGNVIELTNTGNRDVSSSTFAVDTSPLMGSAFSGSGINTVSAADFDGDGDIDIVVGSVSQGSMKLFTNDGSDNFTLSATYSDGSRSLSNDLFDGAATVSLCADFDRDGDVDFVVGTDNWNYPSSWPYGSSSGTGYGGKVYMFRNNGDGTFVSRLIFNGPTKNPDVYDLDCGLVFDYDRDGETDFLIADGNHSQKYYLFRNTVASVYTTDGQAVSVNLTSALDPALYAVTRVRFRTLRQGYIGSSSSGLSVTFYVSNDDGATWESYVQYTGSGLRDYSDLAWHDFASFGAKLRWKAVFYAPEDSMPNFTDASYDTPLVDQIVLEYGYVERREYSRTADALTTVRVSGTDVKLLIAGTFYFPGWQGHLRAYDVTDLAMANTTTSTLQSVSTSSLSSPTGRSLADGVALYWDAGLLLKNRSADSRMIYTATRSYYGGSLNRIEFTASNVDRLGSLIRDKDGDNVGLINFIRGEGRDWKLGDIQHSTPVVVGPPSGVAGLKGSGYDQFVQTWVNRAKVVFVGANDGMLHCFDATTGDELWAYIPYNLLARLKNLSVRDPATGVRTLSNGYYVDGSPAVEDVYINGNWKTVLVCGQGKGTGSTSYTSSVNCYFAMDVTDPANPQPLWEFTASTLGETWSVPAIGKVRSYSGSRWVAFMGSGYNNRSYGTAGNVFYAVALESGSALRSVTVSNINTSSISQPYSDIYVSIPGSPAIDDSNNDGYIESVYVGDLDGRLWRMNTTNTDVNQWTFTAIYTDRLNYPIVSRPAIWRSSLDSNSPAHVLFGTGGDDRAPNDRMYAFLSVIDGTSPSVEWYIGNAAALGLSASLATGSFSTGEKVWADPVVADNIVYFNTLKGSIENVNPCLNLEQDGGRLYARALQAASGGLGMSVLKTVAGRVESFAMTSKARRMVTIGDQAKVNGLTKREVYIQEYDSTIERLEQPGARFRIAIKSWREVYQIIR